MHVSIYISWKRKHAGFVFGIKKAFSWSRRPEGFDFLPVTVIFGDSLKQIEWLQKHGALELAGGRDSR